MSFSDANPISHLKHAWASTHSFMGKACLILFYLFLWVNIIMLIIASINPLVAGTSCFFPDTLSDYAAFTMKEFLRQSKIFALGFFLYADRGGIRFWNVSMVLAICLLYWFSAFYWGMNFESKDGAPPSEVVDKGGSFASWSVVWLAWIGLAWLCSIVEQVKSNQGGTSSGSPATESTPLKV